MTPAWMVSGSQVHRGSSWSSEDQVSLRSLLFLLPLDLSTESRGYIHDPDTLRGHGRRATRVNDIPLPYYESYKIGATSSSYPFYSNGHKIQSVFFFFIFYLKQRIRQTTIN